MTMKFQVLLLTFAVVIATNIHCQAQPQLEDSDKSPEVKGHVMFKRQVKTCICGGRKNAVEQNCPCEPQRQHRILSKEQKAFCQKEGIKTYIKCRQLIGGRKEKKGSKGFSMPI